MTKRLPVEPAPGPLEDYATRFDDLFRARAQREGFRRYLERLLLPTERNKTLTALANTEPVVGAQRKEAQGLQWFLSESGWDPEAINERRVELLLEDGRTAPNGKGALVIGETGDRKDGKKTAHVGRQYLSCIGKIDNGVVSVSSLWADERLYYPLRVEPYTPAHHFREGKDDPAFRTKPKVALELVEAAVERGIAFRAVVADILYGEHRKFKEGLENGGVPYMLAIKPSYAWYRPIGEPGTVEEIAWIAPWDGPEEPGEWVSFRVPSATAIPNSGGRWKPNAGPVRSGEAKKVGGSDHRSFPATGAHHLVSGDEPSGPQLFESGRKRARSGRRCRGSKALLLAKLDRAKLQTGEKLPGVGSLPGQEGHRHPAPLAACVLRIRLLLVGQC